MNLGFLSTKRVEDKPLRLVKVTDEGYHPEEDTRDDSLCGSKEGQKDKYRKKRRGRNHNGWKRYRRKEGVLIQAECYLPC